MKGHPPRTFSKGAGVQAQAGRIERGASTGLAAPEIAHPIRSIFFNQDNVETLMDEVTAFDLAGKKSSPASARSPTTTSSSPWG